MLYLILIALLLTTVDLLLHISHYLLKWLFIKESDQRWGLETRQNKKWKIMFHIEIMTDSTSGRGENNWSGDIHKIKSMSATELTTFYRLCTVRYMLHFSGEEKARQFFTFFSCVLCLLSLILWRHLRLSRVSNI